VIVIRDTGDPDNDPVYRCPQITALQMIDGLPQIYFVPFGVWGKSFTIVLASYKWVHENPDVWHSTATDGQRWRFSNAISDMLAADIAPSRYQVVQSRGFLMSL
jgi:hypothetical protein